MWRAWSTIFLLVCVCAGSGWTMVIQRVVVGEWFSTPRRSNSERATWTSSRANFGDDSASNRFSLSAVVCLLCQSSSSKISSPSSNFLRITCAWVLTWTVFLNSKDGTVGENEAKKHEHWSGVSTFQIETVIAFAVPRWDRPADFLPFSSSVDSKSLEKSKSFPLCPPACFVLLLIVRGVNSGTMSVAEAAIVVEQVDGSKWFPSFDCHAGCWPWRKKKKRNRKGFRQHKSRSKK